MGTLSGIYSIASNSGGQRSPSNSLNQQLPLIPTGQSIVDRTIEKNGPIAEITPSKKTWDSMDYRIRHNVFESSFDPNAYQDANHYGEIFPETYYEGIHIPRLADNFAPFEMVAMAKHVRYDKLSDVLDFKYSQFSFENSPAAKLLNVTI